MTTFDGSVFPDRDSRLAHVLGLIRCAALAVIIAGSVGGTTVVLTGAGPGLGTAASLVVCAYGFLAAIPVYVVMGRMRQSLLS